MEDNEILDLYFARSEQAIAETDQKFGGYCFSIAYNILASRGDSEECVSDTYLAAWNAIPPRRPGLLAAFLGKLTRHISIDRWRKAHAQKRGGGEEVFLGTEDGNLIEMMKMEDGVVSIRFCDYVCQGNVLEDYFTYGFYPNGETTTRRESSGHVYKDIDGTVLFRLLYDTETGTWREGSKYWDSATDIPEEKAREIIARYPRLELEMQPLSQYSDD